MIQPEVFGSATMRDALARRDVPTVYGLLVDAGVAQREIAWRTGQSQSEVHAILRGRPVKQYDVLERIASGLGVDRGAMGLAYAGQRPSDTSEEVDDDMLRRHFLAAATTALIGQPALGQLLTNPTPPDPGKLPARLDASDVAAVEETTCVLRDLSRRYGGHADGVSAVAQRASRLASVPTSQVVRARLGAALGELHTLAGWCCYDAHDDGRALRHYRLAADLAVERDDRRALADVLQHIGIVERVGGRPNDALRFFQLAETHLGRHGDPVLLRLGHGLSALALAAMGQQQHARAALGKARDGRKPPDEFDQADADHLAARVQLQLGLLDSAEQFASTAARAWGDGARREGLLTGITRAEIHLRAGEPDAARMASQSIEGAAGLRSGRARERLLPLADALDARRQPELAGRARQVASSRA